MESSEPGEFRISSNANTTLQSWKKLKQSVEAYIELHSTKNRSQKKWILFHKGGPALKDIFVKLEKSHKDEAQQANDPYLFAINILDKYFKSMVTHERFKFRQIRQNDESIEQFVERLRDQAKNCDFSDQDREIADQIISGTNAEFRGKIFENHLETPDEIIELGKLLESESPRFSQSAESISNNPSPWSWTYSLNAQEFESPKNSQIYNPDSVRFWIMTICCYTIFFLNPGAGICACGVCLISIFVLTKRGREKIRQKWDEFIRELMRYPDRLFDPDPGLPSEYERIPRNPPVRRREYFARRGFY